MTKIICEACGEEKELHAKGLCRKCYKHRYWEASKERIKRQQRGYYTEHREARPEYNRERNLKRLYGITLAEYDQLLEAQENRCTICGKTPEENGRRLSVDHDHKTGEVRGLLCMNCNHGLGKFEDDPELLAKGIKYLLNFMTKA